MNEYLETISEFGALITCAIDTLKSKNSKRSAKTAAVFNIYRMAHEIRNKLKVQKEQNNPATQAIYEELYQETLKSVDETLNILNKFVSNICNDFIVSFSIPTTTFRECLVDALINADLVNKINLLKLKSEFLQIISTYYEEIYEYHEPVEIKDILKKLYEKIIVEINISTDLIVSSIEIKKIIDDTYNENATIIEKHLNFFKRGLQLLAKAIEYCFFWCIPMIRLAEFIKQQIGNTEGQEIIHNLKQDFTFFDDPIIGPSNAEKTKFISTLSANFHKKISQNNDADLEITNIIQKLYEKILYVINNSLDLETSSVQISKIIKQTYNNRKNILIIDKHINLFTLGLELLAETIEYCFSLYPSMKSLAETIKNDPCSFIGRVDQNKFQQILSAYFEEIFKNPNSNDITEIKVIIKGLYDQILNKTNNTKDLVNLSNSIVEMIYDTYLEYKPTIDKKLNKNVFKQGLQFLAQAIESCFSFSPIMKNCAESIKYDARSNNIARDDFSIFNSNRTHSNNINFDQEERVSNHAENDEDIFEELLI